MTELNQVTDLANKLQIKNQFKTGGQSKIDKYFIKTTDPALRICDDPHVGDEAEQLFKEGYLPALKKLEILQISRCRL